MSLRLTDIKKSYRLPDGTSLPVLNVPQFAIEAGEQVALLGESGGGKTTLLNIIAGITAPDSGSVVIDGHDASKLPEAARDRFRAEKIGVVFQTFNLLKGFTALENVLLGMSFSSGKSDRNRAKELLSLVGLSDRLGHKPGQLSVGQQQRVAVARALANSPSLLLADEPTANVDLRNQDEIIKLIRESCQEQNVSLLLVTHSQDVARLFDRVEQLEKFNTVPMTATATVAQTEADSQDDAGEDVK